MNKWILATLLHLGIVCAGASAQTLSVTPVNLSFPVGDRAEKLTLTNRGDRATSYQLRIYRWNQTGTTGEELVPSDDVQVSPPIATVAPGATQLVRIVLRSTPAAKENTYRVIIDEIPPAAVDGQIHVALRISIPIFVQPMSKSGPQLAYRLTQKGNDLLLTVDNRGGAHAKLRDIALQGDNGTQWKLQNGILPYVLAGASRTWRLTSAGPQQKAAPGVLIATSDAGPIRQSVPLEQGSDPITIATK